MMLVPMTSNVRSKGELDAAEGQVQRFLEVLMSNVLRAGARRQQHVAAGKGEVSTASTTSW